MSLPKGWQPTYDERTARRLFQQYHGRGESLSKEQLEELERHSEAYGIPFYSGDFSLLEAVHQIGAGFVEGFTTAKIADYPDNEYEQIARNIGHLAGFAPGMMAAPAKLLGARNFAASVAKIKSLPMKGADILQKYAKKGIKSASKGFTGRRQAMDTTKNYMFGEQAKHVLEGAFHLGAASGLSACQGGVDQMIQAAMGGAQAGGIFRAIGNLTPGTAAHEKMGKAVAGSLFMGLPSTARGDTTPEQVYEYLMGAYFGGNEVSWSRAKARKFVKTMSEKAKDDKEWSIRSGMDPELHPRFDKLPEEVKPLAKEEALKVWGDPDVNREAGIAYEILKQTGSLGEIKEAELAEKGFKATEEYVDGERVYKADPEVVSQKFQSFVTSGGAKGADTEFAKWANTMGITTINYTFGKHAKGIKATGFKRLLTQRELEEADSQVRDANLSIGKNVPSKEYSKNLQRRNWYQV